MRRLVTVAMLGSVSCAPTVVPPPPPPPPGVATDPPSAAPEPEGRVPASSAPVAASDPEPVRPPEPPPPLACVGTAIDLAQAMADERCLVPAAEPFIEPRGVKVTVAADPQKVRPGQMVTFTVTYENPTNAPIELDFRTDGVLSLGVKPGQRPPPQRTVTQGFTATAEDARHRSVEPIAPAPPGALAEGVDRALRVVLEPGARAVARLRWLAMGIVPEPAARLVRSNSRDALRPGRYFVTVRTPLLGERAPERPKPLLVEVLH